MYLPFSSIDLEQQTDNVRLLAHFKDLPKTPQYHIVRGVSGEALNDFERLQPLARLTGVHTGKSYQIKLKSDCIYHFPIHSEQQTDTVRLLLQINRCMVNTI